MDKKSKIFVAGHRGLAGSAIVRHLGENGFENVITQPRQQLDLISQKDVEQFFERERPEYVFLAAAKVGGIVANSTYPAEFTYQNIMISTNIIRSAQLYNVKGLLNLGSSCIYPKNAPQPLKEEYLMTSSLEETNKGYAVAKISAVELCDAYDKQYGTKYISVMPPNLYGPNDNFHPQNSHVMQGIMRRLHEAKHLDLPQAVIWGTGNVRREYLYADDLADACISLIRDNPDAIHDSTSSLINVGYGVDFTVQEIAQMVAEVVSYRGDLVNDTSKPDGVFQKLLDSSKMAKLGWKPKIELHEGLKHLNNWFLENHRS